MWATTTDAALIWPDAATMDVAHLELLLAASEAACQAYAPALAVDAPVPPAWKLAVVYQAREIHQAGRRTGDSEAIGDAGFAIRVRPLSDSVKALLRPARAIPGFGHTNHTATPTLPGSSSDSLTVVASGAATLPSSPTAGTLVGFQFTGAGTIAGIAVTAGVWIARWDGAEWLVVEVTGWTGAEPVDPGDTTAPTAGTLAGSSITSSGFTLTVSGASDETALHATPYAFSTNGGSSYSTWQSSAVFAASGLTASTGYSCRHKVRDAATNESTGSAITVTTDAAALTYAEQVMADSPTHFWPLDTDGADAVGSLTLTPSGGATFSTGIGDGAGALVMPTGTATATGAYDAAIASASAFTLEGIIRMDVTQTASQNWRVFRNGTVAGLSIYNGDRFATGLLGIINGLAPTVWTSGTRAHIAITYDGTTIRTYINGLAAGTAARTGPVSGGTGGFILGGDGFVGAIDGVAFYIGAALSPARLLAHATAAGL